MRGNERGKAMKRLLLATACLLAAGAVHAADLRIGIQEDPDLLDPAQGGSFVDRIVFTALCDKLVDIGPKLDYVPQLATEWSWAPDALSLTMKLRPGVVFHDGEKFDAAAVKYNIERNKTLPESRRKGELAPVSAVEVVDDLTVRFKLSEPYVPLLGVLSDRAGMMVSPKAAEAAGARLFNNPVCSGPYRFVERIAQDRIVLRKFDGYRDRAAFPMDTVTYRPMPDPTIRLANLRSGQLDMIERVNPTDLPQIRSDQRVRLIEAPSVAYQALALNLNNGERANTPFSKNPKIREALELSIDRTILNQVVFNGEYIPSNQPLAPGDPYHAADFPVPKRDVARAKQLLAEAGATRVPLTIYVATNPVLQQVAQVIQSMAAETGFDVKIEVMEAVTVTQRTRVGDFQSAIVVWSGRPDPDGNISIWHACNGFLNWGKYCDPKLDDLLQRARATTAVEERRALYREASALFLTARPHLVLYHLKWHWATSARLKGFEPYPDGLIRLRNVSTQ
jgi:peptide/nickel transport system substrate-binding protein